MEQNGHIKMDIWHKTYGRYELTKQLRQKAVRIANQLEFVWATMDKDELVGNSDDEKQLYTG